MSNTTTREKIIITGIARDVAPFLPEVLINIDVLRSIFDFRGADLHACFFVSDCKDTTHEMFEAWATRRRNVTILFESDTNSRYPQRTQRLAYARNQIRKHVMQHHNDAFAIIVMDLDDVNMKLDISAVIETVKRLGKGGDIDVYGANQTDKYYDSFALRTLNISRPCLAADWARCSGLCKGFGLCSGLKKHSHTFRSEAPSIDVDSCFGGLAIYSRRAFFEERCEYVGHCDEEIAGPTCIRGKEVCEHVPFHQCLKRTAAARRIVVEPTLLNEGPSAKRKALPVLREPISARATPRAFFHWSREYLQDHTEARAAEGFFAQTWKRALASGTQPTIVWIRMGSHAHTKHRGDLDSFAEEALHLIPYHIVLITGDGDAGPDDVHPRTLQLLRESGRIATWFAQNCTTVGTFHGLNLRPYPIGLDAKLDNSGLAPACYNKEDLPLQFLSDTYFSTPLVAIDCHINLSDKWRAPRAVPVMKGCSRSEVSRALRSVGHSIVAEKQLLRNEVHNMWKRACFVACCEGNGVDCHRTYEVIALGRIPVVPDRPAIRNMLAHLPVVFSSNLAKDLVDPHVLQTWCATLRPRIMKDVSRCTWGAHHISAGLWLADIQAARYVSVPERQMPSGFLEWNPAAIRTSSEFLNRFDKKVPEQASLRFRSFKLLFLFSIVACAVLAVLYFKFKYQNP